MTETVTMPKAEVQRLRLELLFTKQAAQRGLFIETAREFADRAAASAEFALDSEGNLDADDWTAGVFLDALQEEGKTEYLFQTAKPTASASDDRDQRQAEADRIAKLPPLKRLEIANARKFAEMGRR